MEFKEEIVFPGTLLCYEEEAIGGYGTYVEDGKVYASVVGVPGYNKERQIISVIPRKQIFFPKRYQVVYGIVKTVMDERAIVEVKVMKKAGARWCVQNDEALISISQVSQFYVKNMRDAFQVGDLIRAQISTLMPRFTLSTKRKDLGVVVAYCTNCRVPMEKTDRPGVLRCPRCKRTERRVLSEMYGSLEEMKDISF